MSAALHETFLAVLRAGRADFNDRFRSARRVYQGLDSAAFAVFLEGIVDPWLRAALEVKPECAPDLVSAGYDAGLTLVGQRLIGDSAQGVRFGELLRQLLTGSVRHSVAAPRRFSVAASNALYHLVHAPSAFAEWWVSELARLGPSIVDFEQWLRAAQVLAWRAGLSQYRSSALGVAAELPPQLAATLVGAPGSASWPELHAALVRDPWFVPATPRTELRGVMELGAFRGFGGLFRVPPRVLQSGSGFLVESDGEAWLLFADAFGGMFQRASDAEFRAALAQTPQPNELRFEPGFLVWREQRLGLPSASPVTSFASNETTVVCAFEASHALALVALPS